MGQDVNNLIFAELSNNDVINLDSLNEKEKDYLANRTLIFLVKKLNSLINDLTKIQKKIDKIEKDINQIEEETIDENIGSIQKLTLYDELNNLLIDYNYKKEIKDLLFNKISERINIIKSYLNK